MPSRSGSQKRFGEWIVEEHPARLGVGEAGDRGRPRSAWNSASASASGGRPVTCGQYQSSEQRDLDRERLRRRAGRGGGWPPSGSGSTSGRGAAWMAASTSIDDAVALRIGRAVGEDRLRRRGPPAAGGRRRGRRRRISGADRPSVAERRVDGDEGADVAGAEGDAAVVGRRRARAAASPSARRGRAVAADALVAAGRGVALEVAPARAAASRRASRKARTRAAAGEARRASRRRRRAWRRGRRRRWRRRCRARRPAGRPPPAPATRSAPRRRRAPRRGRSRRVSSGLARR